MKSNIQNLNALTRISFLSTAAICSAICVAIWLLTRSIMCYPFWLFDSTDFTNSETVPRRLNTGAEQIIVVTTFLSHRRSTGAAIDHHLAFCCLCKTRSVITAWDID